MARDIIPTVVTDLNEIAQEIKARIQAYADLHGISFEEAQKRARLTVNGKTMKIGEVADEQD